MTLQLRRDTAPIRMRNYGRIVQDMVRYASGMEPGLERDSLEVYIAHCMRQRNMLWNRDQESGVQRIREDIMRLSEGKLRCESQAFERFLSQPNTALTAQKKKKK